MTLLELVYGLSIESLLEKTEFRQVPVTVPHTMSMNI